MAVTGEGVSTMALKGSTEEEQFQGPEQLVSVKTNGDGGKA